MSKQLVFIFASLFLVLGIIFLPPPLRNFCPVGFGLLFAVYGGIAFYLGYTVSKFLISHHAGLLKKNHIEYFYIGLNPRINLKEVSQKLADEHSLEPAVLKKIENQKDYMVLALIAFLLVPLSAIALNVMG